ncbi:sensor histidine kinase [Robertkochia flava]|uniref:sensor histidine kinase n=1 Tax=Robertkochia flava TaxID=3447986 RepID=UPI001CCF5357|nr:ATP-binding protein [Robertkochia marina]
MRTYLWFFCLVMLLQSCADSSTEETLIVTEHESQAYSRFLEAMELKEKAKKDTIPEEANRNFSKAWDLQTALFKEELHDTLKAKVYQQMIGLSRELFLLDSTLALTHGYEKMAMDKNDSTLLADAYYRLSYYYSVANAINASHKYGVKGIALAKKIKDSSLVFKSALTVANMLRSHSLNREAEKVALEGLPYTRKDSEKLKLFNVLATVSGANKDYNEKIYWLNEALKLAKEDKIRLILQNNLAMGYFRRGEKGDKRKSMEILEDIRTDSLYNSKVALLSPKLRSDKARALANLGYVKADLGLEGSMALYEEARDLWSSIGAKDDLASVYYRMALYNRNDLVRAREFALKSLDYARDTHMLEEELDALKLLVEIHPNPKAYALQFQNLNDSLNREVNNSQNLFGRYLYDVERTRTENNELEAQAREQQLKLERSRMQNIALTVGIALLLGAGFQSYRLMRTRHLLQQSEEIRKTESRIAKRIHDELANDLYNTMTFAELNNLEKDTTKSTLLDNLEHLYQRTRDISRDNATVVTGKHFDEVLDHLIEQYQSGHTNILARGLNQIDWSKVETHRQEALYRSLQELLVNMRKHSEATLVVITFTQQGKLLQVTYKDNGKGMKMNGQLENGGLHNMKSRVTQTGGRFKLDSAEGKGVKVEVVYG